MVNLEVWLDPGFDMEKWTATGRIDDCGPLGPIERSGWLVEEYVVDYFRKLNKMVIDHYSAFQNPEVAAYFDLKGDEDIRKIMHQDKNCSIDECENFYVYEPIQCTQNNVKCATLLVDFPESTENLLKHQITKFKLLVNIAWVGDFLENIVEARTQERKQTLFFHKRQTLLSSIGKFVRVGFPDCEDEASICDFEVGQMEKVVWSKIKTNAPLAFYVLRKMQLDQLEYMKLLRRHDELSRQGRRISEVASASMAAAAVNRNQSILFNYKLEILEQDGQCRTEQELKSFINYVSNSTYRTMVGILASAEEIRLEEEEKEKEIEEVVDEEWSLVSKALQLDPVTTFRDFVNIDDDVQVCGNLSDKDIVDEFRPLSEEEDESEELIHPKQITFNEAKSAMHVMRLFIESRPDMDLKTFNAGMTAANGFVWFLPLWLSDDWFSKENIPGRRYGDVKTVKCSTAEMIEAVNGHMSITYKFYADNDTLMQEGKPVGEWIKEYTGAASKEHIQVSPYGGYAYDAVWAYALALDVLFKEDASHVTTLHTSKTSRRLADLLNRTHFNGVTGSLQFASSKPSDLLIWQWVNFSSQVIGIYRSNIKKLELNESKIVWLMRDGRKPIDDATSKKNLDFPTPNSAANFEAASLFFSLFNIIPLSPSERTTLFRFPDIFSPSLQKKK
ncbi:uncharacterized protein LOC129227910 [Uloborus diversus]|uniref:uncharacterized protein LOC129227910 n=1 Tax=Uloborus diversus TaxID=327109 RepID=UPI00240A4E2D|nr:uncharacterized protein LOC129227910 [Uloborus diversus]